MKETFLICVWNNEAGPCEDMIRVISTDHGRCFQFNGDYKNPQMSSGIGPLSGLRLIININHDGYLVDTSLSAGAWVTLHDPKTQPDVHNEGFLVAPGTATYARIDYHDIQQMPAPYKSRGENYCYDEMPQAGEDPPYDRKRCTNAILAAQVQRECACRIVPVDDAEQNRKCVLRDLLVCMRPLTRRLQTSSVLNSSSYAECPRLCHVTEFNAFTSHSSFPSKQAEQLLMEGGLTAGITDLRGNVMELRVFYTQLIKNVIKYEPHHTWESILGSVGGQMGLFMGASVLTLCEVLECLCGATKRYFKRHCKRSFPRGASIEKSNTMIG